MKTIALLLPVVLLTGCVGPKIETPAGYQEVEAPWMADYKALSAEASAIRVDTIDNPKDAKLDFVAETCRNFVARSLGYTLAGDEPVKTAAGLEGREMLFTHEQAGVKQTYLLAVFVRGGMGSKIIRVQAGGEAAAFDKDLPKVREAIQTLQ
jgi:hypothetical protein